MYFKGYKRSLKILLCGVVVFLAAGARQSQARVRPFFQASRALAMGDAYTAYDIGYESVYYNPAGVARRNTAQVKYIDLELAGSQAMYNYFKSSLTSLGSLSKIATNVAKNPGEVHSLGVSLLPQFLVKNFSIGLIARTYTEALVDASTLNFDMYAYSDLALYMHYGASLFGGVLKIGVGLKALDRAELERTYTPAEYASGISFSTQWHEGIGYGVDAGILLAAPVSGIPTLGIVVQDIGVTKLLDRRLLFSGASGSPGAPSSLSQKINAGLGLNVKHAPGVKSGFSFELKDAAHVTGSYLDHFHAGWEVVINRVVYLRAGVNQGRYWTGGVGFFLAGVGLEFATYGENLLFGTGSRRDDRKYVGRYVLSL